MAYRQPFSTKISTTKDQPELPREAKITLVHQRKDGTEYATDHLLLSPQQYEYLLSLLTDRAEFIKKQPGSTFRENLVEEREFAIDLLCTLDI